LSDKVVSLRILVVQPRSDVEYLDGAGKALQAVFQLSKRAFDLSVERFVSAKKS